MRYSSRTHFANKLLLVLVIIIPEEFVIKNILNIAGSVEPLYDLDHSSQDKSLANLDYIKTS